MFEQATRLKLRFNTVRGNVTAEDLWDMPLTHSSGFSLDDLAKSLNKMVKESAEESFVVAKTSENDIIELMFEIVKYVIGKRLEEAKEKENAAEKADKKKKILAILAEKEDDSLKSKSSAALKKMLEEL